MAWHLSALLMVLLASAVLAAAPVPAKPLAMGCRHIKVKVDGRSPTTKGWRLVNHKTGQTITGVPPGSECTPARVHRSFISAGLLQ